ncbi:flagellar biosynthesis protein FliQ [Kangiella sp. HZ709]|uniref:flagellar biosynthesis protein FliQ n=1 Tax=Kangiella sp. HZ709 TaxID=2666328 RepID=UPI0012B13D21|nr:flagellar biosynthesis protein FliQ [Kangiella sp. HZ709]MRX26862.1 flagellar biosynthesis protein FliQ [Kangiella sp. HZ709]
MDTDTALFLLSNMFKTALVIALPILCVSLIVGLLISIFQVVTQIQEMTLTFVPKIIAVVGALAVFGHWMLSTLINYAKDLLTNLPV